MISMYGLKNCDICRAALKWLVAEGLDHHFYDVRKDGVGASDVSAWVAALGWESLLNRRGTTWRGLSDSDKEDVDEAKAIELMMAHPALIKRPIFSVKGTFLVGFKDDQKASLMAGQRGRGQL